MPSTDWREVVYNSCAAIRDWTDMVELEIAIGINRVTVNEAIPTVSIKDCLLFGFSERTAIRHRFTFLVDPNSP